MQVLIAGGAGYIDSTIASACLDSGIGPVILDSLVTGRRELAAGREFYEGDIADGAGAVAAVLQPDRRRSQDAHGPAARAAGPCPGQDDPGAGPRRSVPDHRNGLPDAGWVRPAGLHPRVGPGRRARGRAGQVRFPARPNDRSQPRDWAGTTVRELVDAFNHVVGSPIQARDAARRPGDIAGAYTRIDRATRLLGWQPQYDITEGIRHSLQWAAIRDTILSGDASSPEN